MCTSYFFQRCSKIRQKEEPSHKVDLFIILALYILNMLNISNIDLAKFAKDLGHFWLSYIRMLGHLQLSAH